MSQLRDTCDTFMDCVSVLVLGRRGGTLGNCAKHIIEPVQNNLSATVPLPWNEVPDSLNYLSEVI